MERVLHITSGDIAGENLKQSGVAGDLLVWHDILYEGPRNPGWPDEATLLARTEFLDDFTGGGLGRQHILETLRDQYRKLETAAGYDAVVLWFDACLFDQSMLAHVLACLKIQGVVTAELICVAAFPGIEPYNGIGQLLPDQLASVYGQRTAVTAEQVRFAERVDRAFALQDLDEFVLLAQHDTAPLPFVPAAVDRWLKEQPDPETGLGRLEQLALDAIRSGCRHPSEIFRYVAAHDTPPQYWGDITLWAKINRLATWNPPLARIEGPSEKLPQWITEGGIESYSIYPL